MKRLFEFVCKNTACNNYNIPIERFLRLDDIPQCSECSKVMKKQITTTNFKITGSGVHNPGMNYKRK